MADTEQEAGQVVGALSPALGAIPFVGPLLSAGGAIASGLLEGDAAKKQAAQAQSLREQANALKPEATSPGFLQKLNLDQQTAAGGLPGMQLYKNFLAQQTANHMRAIQTASPNGAASVNAISAALYGENEAAGKLGIQDAEFRTNAQNNVSADLGVLGTQERGLELFRDTERNKMLGQVNALESAATGNKQTSANTITGAIGSTGANIFKNLTDPNYLKAIGIGGKPIGASTKDGYSNATGYAGGYTPAAPTTDGTEVSTTGPANPIWDLPYNTAASYASAPE